MYTAIDIVNLQSDIKSLKDLFVRESALHDEISATIVRLEYFLEHYTDYVNEDDLPLN